MALSKNITYHETLFTVGYFDVDHNEENLVNSVLS